MLAQPLYSENVPQPKIQLLNKPCPSGGIRIAVFADGKIRINGALVDSNNVVSSLRGLAGVATEVCLHRENPEAPEPHPNMLKVLDTVAALKLPVAFYFDAAFQKRVAFQNE